MKLIVAVVGRLKEAYLLEAEADYRKRLRPYATVDVVECKDEAALVAGLPPVHRLCALDERGQSMTSARFATDFIADGERHGKRTLVFAIGGADGHSAALRQRADTLLSFGQLTIAHRLVRLLLLEQVYRGFRIVRGEPYHRE